MELELKFTEVTGCEPVGDLVTTQEESMETAIPEYCPDMARIVDTVGQLRLREKHLTGQQLTVSGSVVLTVLYTSEESAGLRSLSMEVPFSCQVEDKRLMGCTAVCVAGRLLLAEARAVTARKLYLRVMPEFTVSGYANRRQRLCCGVGEDPALRVRRQETELELLTAVEEREFSFTQEAVPEGPPPEDVLMEQAAARVEECRRVGSRLVIKGQAEVCILYRGDNQELAAYRTALPFSQLLDGLDLPEDADVEARIPWVHSEARVLRTENGPAFGITVTVCAALFVRRRQQISCIEDLYSLRQVARVQRQETDLPVSWRRETPTQEAVQQLEFGQGRPFAYLTAADCGGVSVVQEGGKVVAIAGPDGYIYDPDGVSSCEEKVNYLVEMRNSGRNKVKDYADKFGVAFYPGEKPWGVKADVIMPSAMQNDVHMEQAKQIAANGVKYYIEVANMPTTNDALKFLMEQPGMIVAPSKAVNAGGVATSALEMAQNSERLVWTADEVDKQLHQIMNTIYQMSVDAAEEYGLGYNLVAGANIAGFKRVAEAMMEQGVF